MLPSGPTEVRFYPNGQVFFHPTLLARRAREIAEGQRGRIGRDACGRPFVRAADPLAEAPAASPTRSPMRFAWLIRLIRALGRIEAGPPMGRPVGRAR